ncbi:MAG: hypothetical protein GX247_05515 [Mollicutes bacterium]|nr:hypothetical protein [Mollicutes bacterium]
MILVVHISKLGIHPSSFALIIKGTSNVSWMNSLGHRNNILNTNYNQIGVGVAKDNQGRLYWVQMFIRI